MKKNIKNLKIYKRIVAFALAMTATGTAVGLTGCSKNMPDQEINTSFVNLINENKDDMTIDEYYKNKGIINNSGNIEILDSKSYIPAQLDELENFIELKEQIKKDLENIELVSKINDEYMSKLWGMNYKQIKNEYESLIKKSSITEKPIERDRILLKIYNVKLYVNNYIEEKGSENIEKGLKDIVKSKVGEALDVPNNDYDNIKISAYKEDKEPTIVYKSEEIGKKYTVNINNDSDYFYTAVDTIYNIQKNEEYNAKDVLNLMKELLLLNGKIDEDYTFVQQNEKEIESKIKQYTR